MNYIMDLHPGPELDRAVQEHIMKGVPLQPYSTNPLSASQLNETMHHMERSLYERYTQLLLDLDMKEPDFPRLPDPVKAQNICRAALMAVLGLSLAPDRKTSPGAML